MMGMSLWRRARAWLSRSAPAVAESGASTVDQLQMKSDSSASAQEVLAGLVERVTFHNEESGFCVLRTKALGHRDLVTVVGQAVSRG
jgi:exodeoxyribonuclease V alpha subunit